MGSEKDEKDSKDDEKPRHKVTISKNFYLGKTTVTVGQFETLRRSHRPQDRSGEG